MLSLFTRHPQEIGESYLEHLRAAGSFGLRMIGGGIACVIHAIVPGWFVTTGSGTIVRLHAEMVAKRDAKRRASIEMRSVEWVI